MIKIAMSLSALVLFVAGGSLVFAPQEIGATVAPGAPAILIQVLGAALLGFGVMNWTARGSMLGGIYGRAVVSGNQMHMTVGALALTKYGFAHGGTAPFWTITTLYSFGAILFLWLMFGRPRQVP